MIKIKKKKTLIALTLALITSVVFLPRCYDANHATVRIKLTNLPVSYYAPEEHIIDRVLNIFSTKAYASTPPPYGTIGVYIAALEGDTPLVVTNIVQPIDTPTFVELRVPAGAARNIVVLVENEDHLISHYGAYLNVDLVAGEEHLVEIGIEDMQTALSPNVDFKFGESARADWNKITGASYNIYEINPTTGEHKFLYKITNTHYVTSEYGSYGLDADFSFARKSDIYSLELNP